MATNLVYRNTDSQNRVEDLGETLAPGVPVLSSAGLPAVTVTGSADYTKTEVLGDGTTITGFPAGGAVLRNQEVTLAFDGTWEFDKDAFTSSTLPTTDISQGDPVYITTGGKLSTSSGGDNEDFGYFDYSTDYDTTRGFLPVRIGA